jgi:hypothetical protein
MPEVGPDVYYGAVHALKRVSAGAESGEIVMLDRRQRRR